MQEADQWDAGSLNMTVWTMLELGKKSLVVKNMLFHVFFLYCPFYRLMKGKHEHKFKKGKKKR